jgi:hypothetical protein
MMTDLKRVGDQTVKFRLLYEGELAPRQRVSVGDLHSIRMQLHSQIKALWQYRPLSDYTGWLREKPERPGDYAIWERSNDVLFSPLISRKNHLMCELDITLLRQQASGQVLDEGGEIDNRLKTLFEALQKPSTEEAQTAATTKRADDDPIHCLLQDDALVTRVNVETDRLLRPIEGQFDLVAIIQVTVVLTRVSFGTINLLSRAQ